VLFASDNNFCEAVFFDTMIARFFGFCIEVQS